ncbi:MAG: 16S rRNA (guanine(966)-N(2))-methyltransferase RsmD, partial [Clostridia bacterium]|nr:16S rRNA (guanine(966)-N(2))-methyltransferase RsmD [Clostridia bacterium]
ETRPTADRVKQALFNILQFDVEGRSVLDLFAGSGQLGIEALSRGAADCVFVDQNPEAAELIRQNLRAARLLTHAHVLCGDSVAYIRRTTDEFDLAFLDPPYASDLLDKTLPFVAARMRTGGTIVCETAADRALPDSVGEFSAVRTCRYGSTLLWLYRRKGV